MRRPELRESAVILLFAFSTTLLAVNQDTEADGSDPRAVLADVRGVVWVRGVAAGEPERAELGRRLRVGDVVETDAGAAASLFLAGGQILEILGGSRVRITKDLASDLQPPPQLARLASPSLKVLEAGIWVLTDPSGSLLVSPLRGDEDATPAPGAGPLLLSPRRELVIEPAPLFLWEADHPVVVAVGDASGSRTRWRSEATAAGHVRYGRPAPPLLAGESYGWWLEDPDDGGRLTGVHSFEVASPEQIRGIHAFESEMESLARAKGPTLAGFLRCAYLEGIGAWTPMLEAVHRLEDASPGPFARRTRTIMERRMGLDSSAMQRLVSRRGELGHER